MFCDTTTTFVVAKNLFVT